MNIVVCIKQVPDTDEVRIDEEKGTLIREGVPSIINPEDKYALAEAVRLKAQTGATVYAITMGPPQAKEALLEAYALGADEVILLSDRAFAGADTWATAYTLAQAIKQIGAVDIILCGRQAIDGDTAQVGPQIAENLGLPQLTYLVELEVTGSELTAKRRLEDGYVEVETQLPCLVTILDSSQETRYPSIKRLVTGYQENKVQVWSQSDFLVDPAKLGLKASPTQVADTFVPTHQRQGQILQGDITTAVQKLVNELQAEKVL